MNSRRALISFFTALALYGAVAGYYASVNADPPRPVELLFTVATVVSIYLWYYFDAAERSYRRSIAMGGAIIMFSLVAVPCYLARSRPSGARVKALVRFVGSVALALVVVVVAGLPFALFGNGS
jgi:hypothetical protein